MTGIVFYPGWGFDARVFQPILDRIEGRLSRPLTCGWSLGAMAAMRSPDNHPLVLVGATPRFTQAPGWLHAQPHELLEAFATEVAADPGRALRRFAALVNRGDDHAHALTRQMAALLDERTPDAATLVAGLDKLRDTDLRESVASIHRPVLLVHGEHDPLMPLAAARWLADHLPDARLEIFPGCAHAPFLSQPERFADLLIAFSSAHE